MKKLIKICPLGLASDCLTYCENKRCSWFLEEIEGCAIKAIAEGLNEIKKRKIEANTNFEEIKPF